jgi:hypothetical protein
MGIMKKSSLLFLFFIQAAANAFDAIVIVLEAPLLKEPKLNSRVLQTLRKGSLVYVPNEIGKKIELEEDLPEFIQTYDRVGDIAYIPTKYIKIITHHLSESKMPITLPHDPTDYRIEEPIPATYPFDDSTFLRASFSLSTGGNIKAPYDYNEAFIKQTYSAETGAKLSVTRKISFDQYDRYYFGIVGAINTSNNTTSFQNSQISKENRSLFKIGPIITFDGFKTEKLRLTLGTGFTYNYHRSTMTMSDLKGNSEQRLFSGLSFSPFINTMIQFTEVIPMTDIIMGSDLNLFLPHSQKTSDEISIPTLWAQNIPDTISTGLKSQVLFYLGIQVRY